MRAVLQHDIEPGLEERIVSGAKEEDGREISQRKGGGRTGRFAKLNLRVAHHREVVTRGRAGERGRRGRLHLRRGLRFLDGVGGDRMRFVQLLFQLVDPVQILLVDLLVLVVNGFELVDPLVLFLQVLALLGDKVFQLVELLVADLGGRTWNPRNAHRETGSQHANDLWSGFHVRFRWVNCRFLPACISGSPWPASPAGWPGHACGSSASSIARS